MDWHRLIDEQDLAALLPEAYAHFARPVKEGLVVFLSGLPARWQGEVFARQAALGLDATLSVRLGELARACPALHKLGQILARDRRLASELREQFRPLECLTPTVPWEVVERELAHELGPLDERGIALQPPALAEASVAVVVAYNDLNDARGHGVLKILKPDIEDRLACELELLGRVGVHLDERCRELGIPQLDYRESFDQVRTKLACEVRLDQEQRHLELAQRLYANDRDVQIPRLLVDHCSPRVTAMERVFGVKVTDHGLCSAGVERRLARSVARALISRPLLASGDAAIFHCDPHAGNLMHADDGRVAILDWSLVARLSEAEHIALTQLILAAIMFDGVRVGELVAQLSARGSIDHAALDAVVRHWLQRYRQGQFPGLDWLVGLLDDAALNAGLRVSAEMMLFRKSLLTLEGVIADLSPNGLPLDEALVPDFLSHLASELPARWSASLGSREFATRISNRDLLEVACTWPLAAARFWRGALPGAS